ncbi:MAG: flagellar filament capping protein FliD [Thermacetogeniaceae bacterium]
MDIDKIVANLMTAARAPEDALKQNLQVLEWQQDAYRTVNTDLNNLQNTVFNMKLQGSFMGKQVDSSSTAVTASAGIDALNLTHTIEVTNLATAEVMTSAAPIATNGTYTGNLNAMLTGLTTGSDGNVKLLIGDGATTQEFTINPGTQSLNDLINQINSSSLNLKASWDDSLKRFYLSSTKPGQSNSVSYTDESGNLMQQLFGSSNTTQTVSGTDAQVKIDGTSYSFNSNQIQVNGVTYNLKGTTGGITTVTVSNDVDAIVSTIKDFITQYNSTLADINGKLTETRYSNYQPLTDAQLSTGKLTSTQIDEWNAKAKSGLLNNDSLLNSAVYAMRNAMASPVSGLTGQVTVTVGSQQVTTTANQMDVIGITTGSYTDNGKLTLDENKLREALQSNPQAVIDLFTKSANTSGAQITDSSQQGLSVRLYNALGSSISQITSKAGSSSDLVDTSYMGQSMKGINTQISDTDTQLQALETRYYNQFTAMEQAISQLNSQGAWLSQMFGSSTSK